MALSSPYDKILHILDDMQATDITLLDIQGKTALTDYMLICTARSGRHVRAIAETVIESMKKEDLPPASVQGLLQGEWALIDFGDLILHIFQAPQRLFFNLEGLWEDAS